MKDRGHHLRCPAERSAGTSEEESDGPVVHRPVSRSVDAHRLILLLYYVICLNQEKQQIISKNAEIFFSDDGAHDAL
jgi:hypothetical protein